MARPLCQSGIHSFFQALAGLEGGVPAGRDIDFLSGLGIATLKRRTFSDLKRAISYQRNGLTLGKFATNSSYTNA